MTQPEHDTTEHRFTLALDGDQAELNYRMDTPDTVNFTRTFVPNAFRGHGYARQLVDTGLAWARENHFRIKADCWYVQQVLDRGG